MKLLNITVILKSAQELRGAAKQLEPSCSRKEIVAHQISIIMGKLDTIQELQTNTN